MANRTTISRRAFIGNSAILTAMSALPEYCSHSFGHESNQNRSANDDRKPTVFQHACMTLPYSDFSLERALSGIKNAGYKYVAWGVKHRESNGEQVPVMPEDAPVELARTLGKRCLDLGLEPIMMFSTVYPEHPLGLDLDWVLRNGKLGARNGKQYFL